MSSRCSAVRDPLGADEEELGIAQHRLQRGAQLVAHHIEEDPLARFAACAPSSAAWSPSSARLRAVMSLESTTNPPTSGSSSRLVPVDSANATSRRRGENGTRLVGTRVGLVRTLGEDGRRRGPVVAVDQVEGVAADQFSGWYPRMRWIGGLS